MLGQSCVLAVAGMRSASLKERAGHIVWAMDANGLEPRMGRVVWTLVAPQPRPSVVLCRHSCGTDTASGAQSRA